jgi:hypothetical protein
MVKHVTPQYTLTCITVAREVTILLLTFILLDRRVDKSSPD